jgi:hypothetical protein
VPLKGPRKGPKSQEGKKKLHDILVSKGLAKAAPADTTGSGRPERYIDKEQLKRLALIDCTDAEMALILGIGQDQLSRRFRDFIDEHRAHGKASLRRLQLRIAQGQEPEVDVDADGNKVVVKPFIPPNPAMAIHLGKSRLNQVGTTNINNIAVMGPNSQEAPQGGPRPYMANMLAPETADALARKFMELCPDPALIRKTVVMDKSKEVQVA